MAEKYGLMSVAVVETNSINISKIKMGVPIYTNSQK